MPRYSKEFITEIKSRLRVSEVVGKFVKLTQRGNEYVGLSPFKNEVSQNRFRSSGYTIFFQPIRLKHKYDSRLIGI